MSRSTVAALTDFGTSDTYAGVMKAIVLSRRPDARWIDLTHRCRAGCVVSAAYLLESAWPYLPSDTVVLAVVDPGVGSSRRELIATGEGKVLVAPDNGIVSLVRRMGRIKSFYGADPEILRHVANAESMSATFHGRDLFAPIAAALLCDDAIIGARIEPVLLPELERPMVTMSSNERLDGIVVHVDSFGNVVTSIHRSDLADGLRIMGLETGEPPIRVDRFAGYFAAVDPGQELIYVGSSGFIELAVRDGNAAERHGIAIGSPARLLVASVVSK